MNKDYQPVTAMLYEDQSGILIPKAVTRRFKKSGMTVVFNSVHKIIQLRKASVAVLYFLAEQMDRETNEITNGEQLRSKFKSHLKNMGVKPILDSSHHKAIQELVKTDFLIKTPTRGLYIVNPRHIHKTSLEKRGKLLEKLLNHLNEDAWHRTNLLRAMGSL